MLYATADGSIFLQPIVKQISPAGDWRDVVIDALLEAEDRDDVERAEQLFKRHKSEELRPEPETQVLTLPFFSVDTLEEAEALRRQFCKLHTVKHHPDVPDEPWYVAPGFNGSLEPMFELTERMRSYYLSMQVRSGKA